ncbi:MAG: type I DNA topoisomerase [Deltaproteobacteria bacterium]|jgi:DNA topoisomerase-1|nr:type I DNA topoisomerase [Deltaproteobacteria bacterium]
MKLLIVESPGKIKKIRSFLKDGWSVAASVGHVRDLPLREKGVSPPDFVPRYEETERGKKVLDDLRALAGKASSVYLGTDQDREGEAIAWHIADSLGLSDPKRITYTEITEQAVRQAIDSPRPIDMNLVRAQEGRRVLDRLYGYNVSPALKSVSGQNLSAGRVQSPALRLVVERERAIRAFVPQTFYGVELSFGEKGTAAEWKAVWNPKDFLKEGEERLTDKALAEKAAEPLEVAVALYEEGEQRIPPPPPFITSTMQQAASNVLKTDPKHTMALAQSLYEAGHITYMRTDNPNMSDKALEAIRELALKKGWPLPDKPRTFKAPTGSQEAHEAIRPTKVEAESAGECDLERQLYKLIRARAIASQLQDALYATTKGILQRGLDGRTASYEAKGRRALSLGWKELTPKDQSKDEKEQEPNNPVPKLAKGERLVPTGSELKTKKTVAPQRYTQASLIRDLEKRGIGRPSTYAAILENITRREYVTPNKKRQLEATRTGEALIEYLAGRFAFLEYDFTKGLENRLDEIAKGSLGYLPVVSEANGILERELREFFLKTDKSLFTCPACGGALTNLRREDGPGRKGYNYWKCQDPACATIMDDLNGAPNPLSRRRSVLSDKPCPACQAPLRHLTKEPGPHGGGYDYWRCSREDCMMSYEDEGGSPAKAMNAVNGKTGEEKCLKCGSPLKHMFRQKSADRDGYNYWSCTDSSCSAYYDDMGGKPDPLSVRQSIPSAFSCPSCNHFLRHHVKETVGDKKGYNYWRCSERNCRAAFNDREGGPDFDSRYVDATDVPCPSCGSNLRHLKKSTGVPADDYDYWRCTKDECGAVYTDKDGAPDLGTLRRSMLTEFRCPVCDSKLRHLVRAEGKLGKGYDYWTCADRDCGTRMDDLNGEPDLANYSMNVISQHLCPECGTSLRHLKRTGDKADAYDYWKCPEPSCGNQFSDRGGAPDFASKTKSVVTDFPCPECGSKLSHKSREDKPGDPGYNYWVCSNRDCKSSYSDDNGSPSKEKRGQSTLSTVHFCEVCGKPLRHVVKVGDELNPGYDFWGCSGFPECRVSYADDFGKPGARKPDPPKPSTEFMCPTCGKPMVHRVKEGDDTSIGYDFWGCTGFPNCRVTLRPDEQGNPDYSQAKKEEPSGFKCPACKSDLIRRKGVSAKTGYDYDFFACTNRNCNRKYESVDGKPLDNS